MKKVIMVCFILAAFLYVSVGCEDDKGGSYTLTGTLVNKLRVPMAGRTIMCVTDYEDTRIAPDTLRAVLGSNGEYQFKGLDFGNYNLSVIFLDTLDYFRTFTDTNGAVTRKPVYVYSRQVGMSRNETWHDTILSSGLTAGTVKGMIYALDTLLSSTGTDSIVDRADRAVISFTVAPGTNFSNPVLRTTPTNGYFEMGGIPRVSISAGAHVPYVLNCRIDAPGFVSVQFDTLSINAAAIDLDTLHLVKQ